MNADPPVRHPRVKGGALFRLLRRLAATERELRHVQRLNRHLTSELAHRQHQQPLLVPYPVPNSDAPGTPPHIALLLALWIRACAERDAYRAWITEDPHPYRQPCDAQHREDQPP